MKLYSLNDTGSVVDPESGTQYDADDNGAFEFPAELGERLHGTHFDGAPVWETDGERSLRLVAEEEARRRDPATLLAQVEKLTEAMNAANAPSASEIRAAAEKAAADAAELAKAADDAEAQEEAAAKAAEDEANQSPDGAGDGNLEVPAGTLEERFKWASEGETDEERGARASAVYNHELDADPDVDKEALGELARQAVYGSPSEVPKGAPTLDDGVDKINEYLDGLQKGDDVELYASERARLIDGERLAKKPRKGLVETGPHAGSDLL